MTAEFIEQAIQDWEVAQSVIVPQEIRRKIIQGYQPKSQREFLAILATIRAVRPEQFSAKSQAATDTVSDLD